MERLKSLPMGSCLIRGWTSLSWHVIVLANLKHIYNLSDEELVLAWSENVYHQFFSGRAYYEPKTIAHPTDSKLLATSLCKWPKQTVCRSRPSTLTEATSLKKNSRQTASTNTRESPENEFFKGDSLD